MSATSQNISRLCYTNANDFAADKSNNIYIIGGSTGIGSDYDYTTIKYAPNGTLQWTQRFNGAVNGTDAANDIAVNSTNNVYITGASQGTSNVFEFATVKYKPGLEVESIVPIANNDPAIISFTQSNDYKSYIKHFGVLNLNNVQLVTYKNTEIKTLLIVADSTDSIKRVVYANFNLKNNANKFFSVVLNVLGDRTLPTSFTGHIQFLTVKANLVIDIQLDNGIVTGVLKEKKKDDGKPSFGECLTTSLDALFEFSSGDGSGIICAIFTKECIAAAVLHCTFE